MAPKVPELIETKAPAVVTTKKQVPVVVADRKPVPVEAVPEKVQRTDIMVEGRPFKSPPKQTYKQLADQFAAKAAGVFVSWRCGVM